MPALQNSSGMNVFILTTALARILRFVKASPPLWNDEMTFYIFLLLPGRSVLVTCEHLRKMFLNN